MSLRGRDLTGMTLEDTYRVAEVVGYGGMATVYRAVDLRVFDRQVAVKVPDARADDEKSRERFRREVQGLVRIGHPNVVRVFDVGEADDGTPYLVMDYMEKGSLSARLEKFGRQSLGEVLVWLQPIADALDFIHTRGVFHRDVKPANILFDAGNHAHLSDFGLSRALGDLTKSQTTPGSPIYMAPECWTKRDIGPASDQYSLAASVYEALSGQQPHAEAAERPESLMYARISRLPRSLADLAPNLPAGAASAVMRALASDAGDRFSNCKEFASVLAKGLIEVTLRVPSRDPRSVAPPALPTASVQVSAEQADGRREKAQPAAAILDARRLQVSMTTDTPTAALPRTVHVQPVDKSVSMWERVRVHASKHRKWLLIGLLTCLTVVLLIDQLKGPAASVSPSEAGFPVGQPALISGSVIDQTGAPLPGVAVTVWLDESADTVLEDETDANGTFGFYVLLRGLETRARLRASLPGVQSLSTDFRVRAGFALTLASLSIDVSGRQSVAYTPAGLLSERPLKTP